MTDRPDWCYEINKICGCYPGNGPCRLNQEIGRGYPRSRKAKQKERERIAELAEDNPKQVARMCLRADY